MISIVNCILTSRFKAFFFIRTCAGNKYQPFQVSIKRNKKVHLLIYSIQKFNLRRLIVQAQTYFRAIGDGLITSDGKLWASHSKVAIPAFTNSMLESYLKIMERETKIFMKKMLKHEDDEFFDIHEEITSLSLDGEIIFK